MYRKISQVKEAKYQKSWKRYCTNLCESFGIKSVQLPVSILFAKNLLSFRELKLLNSIFVEFSGHKFESLEIMSGFLPSFFRSTKCYS